MNILRHFRARRVIHRRLTELVLAEREQRWRRAGQHKDWTHINSYLPLARII